MPQYRTVNFKEEWMTDLENWLNDYPQYQKPKQFIQEAVNEKRRNIEQQENEQLLQALNQILKQTEITREEVKQILSKQE